VGDHADGEPANEHGLLTVSEVADIWLVSKKTVYRKVHSGALPAVRIGQSFRIPIEAVPATRTQSQ
jgi:excisionase family DNA binding protein